MPYRSVNIQEEAGIAIQHMQKAMDQINIKLTNVLSDITGKSGMEMLKAILHGNHCPKSLAALADPRCKAKPEDIGTWDTDHLFELKQSLEHYEFLQAQNKECDQEIEKVMIQYTAVVDTSMAEFIPSKKKSQRRMLYHSMLKSILLPFGALIQ